LPNKEEKEPTFLDRLLEVILRQALGAATKAAERVVKRTLRVVGLVLAGIVIAVLGVAFLAVGAAKWLAMLMPGWLAWALVGVILFLVGVSLTSLALASSRT
jgi:hypothetical protein